MTAVDKYFENMRLNMQKAGLSTLIILALLTMSILTILYFSYPDTGYDYSLPIYIMSAIAFCMTTIFLFCIPTLIKNGCGNKYTYSFIICGILLTMIPCFALVKTGVEPSEVKLGAYISSGFGLAACVATVLTLCISHPKP